MEKTSKKSDNLNFIIRMIILQTIFILALYNIIIVIKHENLTLDIKFCTLFVVLFTVSSVGVIIYLEMKRS
jgi:hypothetical protein